MVKYFLEKPTETGMIHLFLVLPHVAELRKTEAFGRGEMSSATHVETLVLGVLEKKMKSFSAFWCGGCAGEGLERPRSCLSWRSRKATLWETCVCVRAGYWVLAPPPSVFSIPQGELLWWVGTKVHESPRWALSLQPEEDAQTRTVLGLHMGEETGDRTAIATSFFDCVSSKHVLGNLR